MKEMERLGKARILGGNVIKLFAALFMTIDHIGVIFFPYMKIFRIIGRISMPLFAFLLAEGCRYTGDRTKHFALLFILACVCQAVYFVVSPDEIYLSILFTFSLSTILIYSLQNFKRALLSEQRDIFKTVLFGFLFVALVSAVWTLCSVTRVDGKSFRLDYGFWGCMLAVFVSLPDFRGINLPEKAKFIDSHGMRIVCFSVGLLLLCLSVGSRIQWFSFISLVFLLPYSGKKGKPNIKYFFYIFYPLHLAVLYGISLLI